MEDAFAPPRAVVDWARARRRELLLPGAGLAMVGAGGLAAARALLAALWFVGGVALLGTGGASAIPVALPLLGGVVLLYATGVREVDAIRAGRQPLWTGRRLLWVVVAVTALPVVLGVVLAIASAGGPGSAPAPGS